jgi:hypothetical protein
VNSTSHAVGLSVHYFSNISSQPVFVPCCVCTFCTAFTTQRWFSRRITAQSPNNITCVRLSPLTPYNYRSPCNSIVIKGWDRSRPTRLGTIQFYPEFPAVSSSESSLLAEQMLGKRLSCSKYVTPRRMRRSTDVIDGDVVKGYVLVPNDIFNLII